MCVCVCVCVCVHLFRSVVETCNMAPAQLQRERHGHCPCILDTRVNPRCVVCRCKWPKLYSYRREVSYTASQTDVHRTTAIGRRMTGGNDVTCSHRVLDLVLPVEEEAARVLAVGLGLVAPLPQAVGDVGLVILSAQQRPREQARHCRTMADNSEAKGRSVTSTRKGCESSKE